jgi:hypothetical protein
MNKYKLINLYFICFRFGIKKSSLYFIVGNLRQKLFGTEDDLVNQRVASDGKFASLRRLADMTLQSDNFVRGVRTGFSNLYTVRECPRWAGKTKAP